jgi:2-polyprenyl-6-methoxyphenol hydroxylase-like FAD-dependent oxidoreductase
MGGDVVVIGSGPIGAVIATLLGEASRWPTHRV